MHEGKPSLVSFVNLRALRGSRFASLSDLAPQQMAQKCGWERKTAEDSPVTLLYPITTLFDMVLEYALTRRQRRLNRASPALSWLVGGARCDSPAFAIHPYTSLWRLQ